MYKDIQDFKEDIVETFLLIKVCLTSFWFWVPVLYAAYLFIQIWMFIAIHPLTLFILPSALAIYSLKQEKKRMKAQYGIQDGEHARILRPYSLIPQELKGFKWDIEKSLEEYQKMTKKKTLKETKD
jgi:hypothetical protein